MYMYVCEVPSLCSLQGIVYVLGDIHVHIHVHIYVHVYVYVHVGGIGLLAFHL